MPVEELKNPASPAEASGPAVPKLDPNAALLPPVPNPPSSDPARPKN